MCVHFACGLPQPDSRRSMPWFPVTTKNPTIYNQRKSIQLFLVIFWRLFFKWVFLLIALSPPVASTCHCACSAGWRKMKISSNSCTKQIWNQMSVKHTFGLPTHCGLKTAGWMPWFVMGSDLSKIRPVDAINKGVPPPAPYVSDKCAKENGNSDFLSFGVCNAGANI